ncbi:hypothetical protein F2P56_023222 [Juglans regia]|uniref:Reverse transcriptase zinc-binding domain-containing protein n=1 Tax=Juglans regia TaxID=51240 RepID=A0A833U0Q7_JUGRE|nr:hypothetical protein F2P56_023222 [Juglans regia]
MAKFWWSSQKNENRIQWKSWAKMGTAKTEEGMGFRELQSFNTALLAKQCWRIMTMPQSVAARVKIWEDKWIPKPIQFSIQSPQRNLCAEAKVEELLLNGGWNHRLVYDTFLKEEADLICGLPVSSSNAPDKRIWAFSKDGLYSVKSGYHLERTRKGRDKGCSSEAKCEKIVWKSIWQLNTPEVVKVFMWKAVVNSLPTKWNLFRRKVVENSLCLVCGRENETVGHVLWSCNATGDLWADNKSPVQNGIRWMVIL